jgi:FkbM family methyltransferase
MSNDLGFLQKLTRLYTFYSPLRKGKYRLSAASLRLAKKLPRQVLAKTTDGRKLKVNFDNHFAHFVYFIGEYETAITETIKKIVEPGDVCLDIGANIGWYTTLLQTLVGPGGAVHSFEPVPPTFTVLEENVRSNMNSEAVLLNNFALGETEGEVTLHIFKNRSDGHASIADFGETEFVEYPTLLKTLDSYLEFNEIGHVKFVKIDIEGSELSMLRGADRLFRQTPPPIFEIEMARDTTSQFGYLPDDLIKYMKEQSDFEFYAIDEKNFTLKLIKGFSPEEDGANVLCVPSRYYHDVLAKLNLAE